MSEKRVEETEHSVIHIWDCHFCKTLKLYEIEDCPACNGTGESKMIFPKRHLYVPVRQERLDAWQSEHRSERSQRLACHPQPDIFDEKRAEIAREAEDD